MPRDHYVSQVHLKNFYSPALDERMHALRKSDLFYFAPNAKSVCRVEDGNTNKYLEEERAIEEFLKTIEPRYNGAIEDLRSGSVSVEAVYVIAGFAAYVLVCSPAGMRINSGPLEGSVEESARLLDKHGNVPQPPIALGGDTLAELLDSGEICVNVDPKYPQALGIASILSRAVMFGNFHWQVLHNPFEDSPFFTSDFPIAVEPSGDLRILNRIVPLAPDLAIRICPDLGVDADRADFGFSNFSYRSRKLSRPQVQYVNRLIVRSAESVVFFRDNYEWVTSFVTKNASYRIEPRIHRFRSQDGVLLFCTQKISEIA